MEINKPITAIIMIIVSLLLLFLFVLPEYKAVNDAQSLLLDKQMAYLGQEAYYGRIAQLAGMLDAKKVSLSKVQSALPSEFELSPLLYFFQKKGLEVGVVIKSLVFSDAVELNNNKKIASSAKATNKPAVATVKVVNFNMIISGNYQSIKNFLRGLENSSRIFEVTNISFASSNVSSGALPKTSSQIFDVNLQIKTYTY